MGPEAHGSFAGAGGSRIESQGSIRATGRGAMCRTLLRPDAHLCEDADARGWAVSSAPSGGRGADPSRSALHTLEQLTEPTSPKPGAPRRFKEIEPMLTRVTRSQAESVLEALR